MPVVIVLVEGAMLADKQKLTLDASSLDELKNLLTEKLDLTGDGDLKVEVFDKDFGEWSVLGDFKSMGAKAKLKISYVAQGIEVQVEGSMLKGKKKLSIDVGSMDELKSTLADKLDLEGEFKIEIFDDDFEEWSVLGDFASMGKGAKLKVSYLKGKVDLAVEGSMLKGKKKLTVYVTSMEELKASLAKELSVKSEFKIEVFDDDFEEWSVLGDFASMGKIAKLKLSVSTGKTPKKEAATKEKKPVKEVSEDESDDEDEDEDEDDDDDESEDESEDEEDEDDDKSEDESEDEDAGDEEEDGGGSEEDESEEEEEKPAKKAKTSVSASAPAPPADFNKVNPHRGKGFTDGSEFEEKKKRKRSPAKQTARNARRLAKQGRTMR
jgi:hypothetical protein